MQNRTSDLVNYVPVQSNLSWDEYFMLQAMMASFKSKDPNTKVGCVFVDEFNHQITMGYNGHVAGMDESKIPWGNNTDVPLEHQKYGYVVHSEANAILHSPRPLKNSKAYVTLFPCHECAKLIATAGTKEVIFLTDKYVGSQSNVIAKKIFDYAGIKYRQMVIKPDLISKLSQHLNHFLQPQM
jgi:dCMP deaminase